MRSRIIVASVLSLCAVTLSAPSAEACSPAPEFQVVISSDSSPDCLGVFPDFVFNLNDPRGISLQNECEGPIEILKAFEEIEGAQVDCQETPEACSALVTVPPGGFEFVVLETDEMMWWRQDTERQGPVTFEVLQQQASALIFGQDSCGGPISPFDCQIPSAGGAPASAPIGGGVALCVIVALIWARRRI